MPVEATIKNSVQTLPKTEGPIPVTDGSHPFCAMKYSRGCIDPAQYGYLEEEFFLSANANIYDTDENGHLFVCHAAVPYKNRVLVRRPADPERFSGRVYMDILNASRNHDIEDLWIRSYLWCMENGHGYIGVTSKPVNVLSLKNFDYERYESLDWPSPERAAAPAAIHPVCASIPGTEEGLVWDILSQTASLVRYGGKDNCLGGYRVEYLYLTGQSQSGAYLNTYVNHFHPHLTGKDGKKLFDGYMNIVGVQVERLLRQRIGNHPFLHPGRLDAVDTPSISIAAEGDFKLFSYFVKDRFNELNPGNSDRRYKKSRYYEVAGSPHSSMQAPVFPADNEILKTGHPVPLPGENPVNEMPLAYYINGLLEKLHLWVIKGIAPEVVSPLHKDKAGRLLRDQYGNALGGLRSPFLEAPIACHMGYGETGGGEDIPPEDIAGVMTLFTKERFLDIYGSIDAYIEKFSVYTRKQVEDGWVTPSDGERMIQWAKTAALRVCG